MNNMQRMVLAARPDGAIKDSDLRLESRAMPEPGEDEVLVRVVWLSVDPYMRGRMDGSPSYAEPVQLGEPMVGGAVGQVMRSRNSRFAEGDWVSGQLGWQTHAVASGGDLRKLDPGIAPVSTALGLLGMPGFTAYVGLIDLGKPKAGETIVVSAASGAVGSLVGQLARINGLRTVGVAGSDEKCAYAVEELGFDTCISHRLGDAGELRKHLAEACPGGVDIYYENVGGKTLEAVAPLMNVFGRIPVCGMISWYDQGGLGAGATDGANQLPGVWRSILVNRLQVNGFIITDHAHRFREFVDVVSGHYRNGRIRYRESIVEGLESAPRALADVLQGRNFGKQLVKVAEET